MASGFIDGFDGLSSEGVAELLTEVIQIEEHHPPPIELPVVYRHLLRAPWIRKQLMESKEMNRNTSSPSIKAPSFYIHRCTNSSQFGCLWDELVADPKKLIIPWTDFPNYGELPLNVIYKETCRRFLPYRRSFDDVITVSNATLLCEELRKVLQLCLQMSKS